MVRLEYSWPGVPHGNAFWRRLIRILMVAARAAPAIGGVENLLAEVATTLAEDHDVVIAAVRIDDEEWSRLGDSLRAPPPFEPFSRNGVRVVPIRARGVRRGLHVVQGLQVAPWAGRYAFGRARIVLHEAYARATAESVRAAMPAADVVHSWTGDLPGAAGLRAARSLGVPFVVSPFVHPGQWGDDPASLRLYRRADQVIALLEADAEHHRSRGVESRRISVIGSCSDGVDGPSGGRVRAARGIDGPLVLFLGVRRPYKGADLLLAAGEALARDVPGLTLAFVGPGPSLSSSEHVRVIDVGEVDDRERAAWLDAADVLCLPSAAEIFPLSLLEAWSVATPVVVSDIPPLAELVRVTGGGIATARSPDAVARGLRELLLNPVRAHEMGLNGQRSWRARFTPAAVASAHAALYRRLRSGSPLALEPEPARAGYRAG